MTKSLNPYSLDNIFALEDCQQLKIKDYLREARNSIMKAMLEAHMTANGYSIRLCESQTLFGGKRLWFECPKCKKRSGVLYQDFFHRGMRCRRCIGLMYRKQKFKP
jgi:hypothetical protein